MKEGAIKCIHCGSYLNGNENNLDKSQKKEIGKPIKHTPNLHMVNGTGTHIYGDTIYYVIFFIPICPIARYIVEEVSTFSFKFLGELDLHPWQKIWKSTFVLAVLFIVGYLIIMMILHH